MTLLVNCSAGIHNFEILAQNYELAVRTQENEVFSIKGYIESKMKNETIETFFSPDNEHWLNNIEEVTAANQLLVIVDNKAYNIYEHGADLFAIHPDATWDDHLEIFVFKGEEPC